MIKTTNYNFSLIRSHVVAHGSGKCAITCDIFVFFDSEKFGMLPKTNTPTIELALT